MLTALAKRILRAGDRAWLAVRSLRARRLEAGQRPVQRDGRWYLARVVEPAPVAELIRGSLDLVTAACREEGAWFAVLPAADGQSTRVAIRDEAAPAVLGRLVAAGQERAWYAWPRGRRRAGLLRDLDPATSAGPIRIFQVAALADGGIVAGPEHACHLVLAGEDGGLLEVGPDNLVAERFPADAPASTVEVLGRTYPTVAPFGRTGHLGAVEFPIDVVYTWVDGNDPAWRASRDEYLGAAGRLNEEAANASRWIDRDELRYSLRSLHLHAEWVNHVWLVTAGHVPAWLDVDHPGLTVVTHEEIFPDPGVLPTFNSHAIEAQLHRIPGLAEHYLYFNDDVHLGRRVPPRRFFQPNGVPHFFPSRYHLDLGPARPEDPPVMAAGKNGRDLLEARYGRIATQKLKHTPHPQRRSTMAALEATFPEEFRRTSASRFRSLTDVSVASSLVHHFAYLEEKAVPADLPYRYIDLVDPGLEDWMERTAAQRPLDVFCVNDTTGTPEQLAARGPLLQRFLADYFPLPSPFER